MAITVDEIYKSRKRDGQTVERNYYIKGTTDDRDARDAMLADPDCPDTVNVSVGGATYIFVKNELEAGVEELETGVWLGTCKWISPNNPANAPIGYFSLSFDITGQQQKITYSRQTVMGYTASAVKKNFKQAINVNQDGTIDGCDILVPYLTYQAKQIYGPGQITQSFVTALSGIVGTVNDGPYQGYSAGEMLLTRVTGAPRDDSAYDLTFSFAISQNETGLTIGDITGISKDGWDYLWVYYEERDDSTTHTSNKIPINAFVERVYRRTNYNTIGLSRLL